MTAPTPIADKRKLDETQSSNVNTDGKRPTVIDPSDMNKDGIESNGKRTVVVYRELLLLAAIVLGSAGMTLMARSGFGISVVSSVPYVFSLHFTQLTFGTWTFISYVFVILLTIVMNRHFEMVYLASFVVSLAISLCNDLFKFLWSMLPDGLPLQILYYLAGWFMLSLGIASFIKSGLPPAPYELFVRETARFKNIPVSRVKTMLDLVSLVISVLFTLLVLRRLGGIGPGTVVAGLFNGTVVGIWLKLMDKRFQMASLM